MNLFYMMTCNIRERLEKPNKIKKTKMDVVDYTSTSKRVNIIKNKRTIISDPYGIESLAVY